MPVSLDVAVIIAIVAVLAMVAVAAMFGGAKKEPVVVCPRCRTRLFSGRCQVCNWPAATMAQKRTLESLTAVREQIQRYAGLGLMDRAACDRLLESLEAERRQWVAPVAGDPIVVAELAERHPSEAAHASAATTFTPTERAAREVSGSAEPVVAAATSPSNGDELRLAPAAPNVAAPPVSSAPAALSARPHALDTTPASAARPPAAPPRRPVFDLLSAFLEEQNIRWGELIGGLLIVGCSIALVISFWAKIAERPFLKFFVFNGVTAAMFGLGLYAAHRWKLRTTSRAVLLISILLVPLNFLAIAAFTEGSSSLFTFSTAGEAISVLLFAALCAAAARIVTPRSVWLLTIGVLVPSVLELLVRRWVNLDTGELTLLALGGAATAVYAAVNIVGLWRQRELAAQGGQAHFSAEASTASQAVAGPKNEPDPIEIFSLLGTTAFAAALPIGLLLFKTEHVVAAVHQLAVLFSAGGLTPLAVGLFLWQRLAGTNQTSQRTTALSVALAGILLLVAGVVLAWPEPVALLPTALLVAVVLSGVAVRFRLAEIHCGAVACLSLAWLTAWHLAAGQLVWRGEDAAHALRMFVSGASGQALVPLVGLCFAAAALLGRWLRRANDARAVAVSAGAVAAISVGLVTWFGFGVAGDPLHATWIYALYGVAACVAAVVRKRRDVLASWLLFIGAALTLAACVQGVVYLAADRWPLALPWATAFVLDATLMAAAAAVRHGFSRAALAASLAMLVCTVAASIGVPHAVSSGPLAIHWFWLAAVWLGLALLGAWPQTVFAAFQAALAMAAWFSVGVWLETRPWFVGAQRPWLDPWTLQAEGIALALLCLAWMCVRRFFQPRRAATLASGAWPMDSALMRLVFLGLVALSCYAALPGVAQELTAHAIPAAGAAAPMPPAASFEWLELPHAHAQGWGSWLLLAIVVAALAAEGAVVRKWNPAGNIIFALFMACPLAASAWEPQLAVASALRWYAMFFLVAATVAHFALRAADSSARKIAAAIAEQRTLLFFLGAAPALAAAAYALATALGQQSLAGPDPASLFGRMGAAISYAGPLALLALVLVAYAVRERSSGFALAGGLMANSAATVAYLLRLSAAGLPFDAVAWIGLAHINAIVASVYALGWIGWRAGLVVRRSIWGDARNRKRASMRRWMARIVAGSARAAADDQQPIFVLIGLAAACNLAVLVPTWLTIINDPALANPLLPVATLRGWIAALLTAAAILATGRLNVRRLSSGLLAIVLWCAGTLIAATACRWDTGNWLGFHVLLLAHAAAAWIIPGVVWLSGRVAPAENRNSAGAQAGRAARWSLAGLGLVTWLALRALSGDPQRPWWTIGLLASQALLAVWLAWWLLRPGLLYVAMPLVNLAASIWWWNANPLSSWRGGFFELIAVNIAALALPAIGWLAMELLGFRPHRTPQVADVYSAPRFTSAHRFAAWVSLVVLAITVGLKLAFCAAVAQWAAAATPPEWLALAATVAIWIAMLWDGEARDALAGLYFVGLVAAGVVLDQIQPEAKWLWWTGDVILAAYALVTSFLWSARAGLRSVADRLRIPGGPDSPLAGLAWLVPVNCTMVAIVVVLSYGFVLTYDDFAFRLVAAKAVLAQMATLGLLARGNRRSNLQSGALLLGVLGAVAIGWAGLQPAAGTLLNRSVVAAAAISIAAVIYGLGLTKLLAAGNDWLRPARSLAAQLVAVDVAVVLLVLGVEISQAVESGSVAMEPAAVATMTAVLVGLFAAALAAAVLPGRDPLGRTERGRQAYVYGAEALLVALFVHLRLCEPQWFHGILQEYWPLVVQGIAFVGVAMGEWFRRRRWSVVGEPLANTGMLLPLLPVLGYWILPARVDYSVLLLAVGLLYGVLSVMRRSFGFGLLAVLAANGSLWYFLGGQEGLRFFEHPQIWMIPPALCVLIAAQLNRRQLSAEQMTAIRYGVSIVIYVSSTADIFIQGVAQAPWLPLVLAGFSLAGVLLGIVLRVRAFLILGTSFLMLSLLTMIWYAAVDLQQTWLWYASGIVAGAMILAIFAVFEKQRQAVGELLDQLKKWQP